MKSSTFFLNKANYIDITTSTDYCGGSRILRYQITVPTSRVPVPFFSYPFAGSVTTTRTANIIDPGAFFFTGSILSVWFSSISGLAVGDKIIFGSSFSTIVAGSTYYILSLSGSIATISTTRGGTTLRGSTGGGGGFFGGSGTTTSLDNVTCYTVNAIPVYVAITKMVPISTNLWEIYLLVSGTTISSTPEVYVFIEFDKILSPYGSYGLIVYKEGSSSDVTFDSRLKPLLIKKSIDVLPTASPYINSDGSVLSNLGAAQYNQGAESLVNGALVPDNSNPYTVTNVSLTKPIFNYSSIAQAYKQYNMFTDASYRAGVGDIDMNWKYFYNNYASFSRPGISCSTSGTTATVNLGWIAVTGAQYNPGVYEKRERFIGFDSSSRGQATSVGTWKPSTSLNIRYSTLTIADARNYE